MDRWIDRSYTIHHIVFYSMKSYLYISYDFYCMIYAKGFSVPCFKWTCPKRSTHNSGNSNGSWSKGGGVHWQFIGTFGTFRYSIVY